MEAPGTGAPGSPDVLRRLNLLLGQAGSTQAQRFAQAGADPRLSSAGMVLPPGQGGLVLNAQNHDVLPQLLQWAAQTYGQPWLAQQPWYQQVVQSPWAQGAGLLYMLSRGQYPTLSKEWSW